MMRFACAFMALALCVACLGCQTYNHEEVQAFLLKPRAPVSGKEYRVLPPDVLQITSQNVPELATVLVTVGPDGTIRVPMLGEIYVADKTPKQIQEDLVTEAKRYYAQADLAVMVAQYRSQKFYIFGQVAKPGFIIWTGHDTVLDALARGQPTVLAWPERIIVVRGAPPQEGGVARPNSSRYTRTGIHDESLMDPAPSTMTINLMAMIEHGDLSNNILLQPNDIIYVQPNPLAKVGLAIQSLLFPIRPAADTAASMTMLGGGL